MKQLERMFYVALTIGLLIKFPWLIAVGIMICIFLLAVLGDGE